MKIRIVAAIIDFVFVVFFSFIAVYGEGVWRWVTYALVVAFAVRFSLDLQRIREEDA